MAESPKPPSIAVTFDKGINYAFQQNSIPVIKDLVFCNDETARKNLSIRITTEPLFAEEILIRLQSIEPLKEFRVSPVDLKLSHDFLAGLNEKISGWLKLEVLAGDSVICSSQESISVLARNEWCGLSSLPEILAAFVLPNDPAVMKILSRASAILKEYTGRSALNAYQDKSRKRAWEQMASIYKSVAELGIRYIVAPASFETSGQKVRTPSDILDQRFANCLDLALLFAACFEQAGLHPLILMHEGHAYAGCWLDDRPAPDAAIDELQQVRKFATDEFLTVFEATTIATDPNTTLKDAELLAKPYLQTALPFRIALDIASARKAHIKPLPKSGQTSAINNEGDSNILIDVGLGDRVIKENGAQDTPAAIKAATRIDLWKSRLLDLSLRNRLLNFKETKSALRILSSNPEHIEDELAAERELALLPKPKLMGDSDPRNEITYTKQQKAEALTEFLKSELEHFRLHTSLEETEHPTRCTEIYRAAKNSIEENGTNTLYAAVGILEWKETEHSERIFRAPILLVPVELKRKSVLEGFTLRRFDEETRLNFTLLEMLRQHFQKDIPGLDPLPEDESGVDVGKVFRLFRDAVRDLSGWEVKEEVWVAQFSFTKFLLWKDLADRLDALTQNRVVNHLVNEAGTPYTNPSIDVVPEQLDVNYHPSDIFCPRSADSSQLAAVMAAAAGHDFVLEGPPGTGKSQTITNIISHCLAHGRKVLFVAEKRAALDVVFRRLKEEGLEPFCLELHSNKSGKAEVVGQLDKSLKFATSKTGSDWQNRTTQLGTLRDTLNRYAFDLHNRYTCGLSAYSCIDYLLPRKQEQTVSLSSWSGITSLPFEQLERSRNVSKLLQQRSRPLGNLSDHPLSLVAHEDWSPNWADRVTEKLKNLELFNSNTQDATAEFHKWIQAPECFKTFSELRNQCSLIEILLKPEPVGPDFFTANWAQLLADLENWISILRERTGLRQSLASIQKNSSSNPVRLRCEDWNAGEMEQIVNLTTNLQSLTSKASTATKELQTLLGYKCENTSRLDIVNFIAFVDSLLASAPVGEQFPIHRWNEWSGDLDQWIAYIQERIEVRNRLRDYDEKLLLALDLELISSKWESAQTSWFLPKWLKIGFVRKHFKTARKDKANPPKESLGTLVKDSLRLKFLNGSLASAKIKAVQMLGPIWADGEPQLEHLKVVKTWGATFHERLETLTANSAEWQQHLRSFCSELFKQGTAFTEPSTPIGKTLHNYRDAITEYDGAYESFVESSGLIRGNLDKADDHLESVTQSLSTFARFAPRARIITFELDRAALQAKACLGTLWKDGEGNPDAIEKAKVWGNSLNDSLLQIVGEQITWLGQFKQLLSSVFRESSLLLSPNSAIGLKLAKFQNNFVELATSYEDLVQFASIRREQIDKASDFHLAISLLVQKLPTGWGMIREWCSWQKVRSEALQIGLDTIISKLESKDGLALDVPALFERSFRKALLFSIIEQSSALREFFGSEQNENIEQFRNIDAMVSDLTREIIQARLSNRIPQENLVHDVPKSEIGLLRREAGKKMRHIPVRQLLSRIQTLLPRLKPCVLMSPLSVAQYLEPSHATFDVVIFDEASQIPVWDAVGAIARGQQLIVVGDPKQLPPTNFFNSSDSDDDNLAPDEFKDLESILDELMTNGLRHKRLKWHYRSRHEGLITFSNRQYYDNDLLTFPSSDTTNGGVKLRYLPDAKYDKGKSRTNKGEAEALVKELVMRLKNPDGPKRSYGVVTFSLAQQQLVENLLDEERRKSPEIENHFGDQSPVEGEPVFVKNLENVQGDERDVILFSICYGPDESGKVSMNFGPLNMDGGERRLNVAITRAKHEVIVFTGLRADQIDLTRTRAKGVQDLKYFLDYADRGPNALSEATSASADGEADSEFERMVAKKIQAAGYVVHHQVGCSGYRIDLGIVNSQRPGKYLLGVECDGATYHRAATARDRDKLRQSVLEGLGWRLYRIWSTDWWHDSDKEMAKLISVLEAAAVDQAKTE